MSDLKLTIHDIITLSHIIPSVDIIDGYDSIPLMDALHEGGVKTVEIIIRNDESYKILETIKKRVPELHVGAGNIKTPDMLQRAIDIGIDYATSPGNTDRLFNAVQKNDFPFLPGVSNSSDIMRALEYGYTMQKFCPAIALGGVKTLKYLHGHFQEVMFCPAGGLNDDNVSDFLHLPNVAGVTGGWIVRAHDIYEKRWPKIVERTQFAFSQIAA